MGIPEGHQKSIFNTPKVKKKQNKTKQKTKIHMRSIRQFASSTQKHKEVIETLNQPIEINKISNESMFSTSKVKRRQKIVWGLPDAVCRLNPKS
jgi:hypothetical protein